MYRGDTGAHGDGDGDRAANDAITQVQAIDVDADALQAGIAAGLTLFEIQQMIYDEKLKEEKKKRYTAHIHSLHGVDKLDCPHV